MTKEALNAEQKKRVENFLKGYGLNARFLNLDKYQKRFLGGDKNAVPEEIIPRDTPLAKARMFEVRHFILGLENSEEKMFLYYRYVRGERIERCADLFDISRRTVYRLRDRALKMAYENGVDKFF